MADYWEGNYFICDGYTWGVNHYGDTFCAGIVTPPDKPQNVVEALPAKQDIVLLHDMNSKPLRIEKTEAVMLQKHAGGRPRKRGEVSRMTKWRRKQKELQGILI